METIDQVIADYGAYLAQCKEKNIVPNPTIEARVNRIIKLLTPTNGRRQSSAD